MLQAFAALVVAPALTKPVTAIASYGGSLYVGAADGSVQKLDESLEASATYAKGSGEPVSFVAASSYGVAWLTGPGGTIRERVSPPKAVEQTLTIQSGDRVISVLMQPSGTIRRLSWLAGKVAISYDLGSAFYDVKGASVKASGFMPADPAGLAANSSLWVREQEDGTELAVFARPYSVRKDPRNQRAPLVSLFTAYQVGAWQWEKLGGFASNAFDAFPDGELQANEDGRLAADAKFLVLSDHVGLAQDGIVAREPDSLLSVPIFAQDWQTARIDSMAIPGDPLWFGAGGDHAWWWTGAALVEQNRKSGATSAYFPWAGGTAPSCLLADSRGLWIGSKLGLARLDPAKADEKLGFAGYVRAPLGSIPASTDASAKKIADAIFAWRFADAQKAGPDGGVMVASIFSTAGLQLPRTASELMKAGSPVLDELKFGDVLLTDKSAAVYLGNGATVEVRGGRVQNGDVWGISHAVVRRFPP